MAHVLFITHWYPDENNPVSGVFIREHARAVALFHRVSIIHIIGVSKAHPGIEIFVDENLTVYRLGYPKPFLPKTGWLYRFLGTRRIFRELVYAKNQPDIIHAHVYSSSDMAYLLSRIYHRPAVLSEHASVYPRHLLSRSQLSYYRFFMNRLRLILPVSSDLQGHMQRAGFRGPFMVIPNTVDTMLFHPASSQQRNPQNPLTILSVAMLQPVKGVAYLLEAFAALRKMHVNCRLWIVGDGPERQRLQERSEELQITEHISFLGIRTKREVATLMREADLFCLTSLWETQSVSLIEALASGLPVVAPAIGGIPEIIKPEVGVLFEPGNVVDLVEKLADMIDHLNNFSVNASAEYASETFGLTAVGQKFAGVYEQILQNAQ
jgi:glycosyltransferase involved in cell wall biosynthesis